MDPTSVDPLRLLAGVVDVMTGVAALLLAIVLTARLRTSSGKQCGPSTIPAKEQLLKSNSLSFGMRHTPSPNAKHEGVTHHLFVHPSRLLRK